MALILAIEPDARQASQLRGLIQARVGADLVLARTTQQALTAIGDRVPDLVLVPALLAPQDDAKLAAALRVIAAAARVQVLTIPVLAAANRAPEPRGVLARWRRPRVEAPAPDGCDPATFGDQIAAYLEEAAAQHAAFAPAVHVETTGDESPEPAVELLAVEEMPAVEMPAVEEMSAVDEPLTVAAVPADDDLMASAGMLVIQASAAVEAPPIIDEIAIVHEMSTVVETSSLIDVTPAIEELSAVEEIVVIEAPAVEQTPLVEEWQEATLLVRGEEPAAEEELPQDDDTAYELPVYELNADDQRQLTIDALTFGEPFAEAAADDAAVIDLMPIAPSVQIELLALPTPESFGSRSVWAVPEGVVEAAAPPPAAPVEEPLTVAAAADDDRLELWMPLSSGLQRLWPDIEGVPMEAAPPPVAVEPEVRRVEVAPIAAPVPAPVPVPVAAPAAVPVAETAPPAKPEWLELIESLRLDVERLRIERAMPPEAVPAPAIASQPASRPIATAADITPPPKRVKRAKAARPVQDEWGFFDPEQCGFAALLAKLDEISLGNEEAAPPPG